MATNIIDKFVENIIIFNFEYKELDKNYLRNKILFLIGNTEQTTNSKNNIELVKELINQAILNEKINNIQYEKDILEAQLMDFITPSPSAVNGIFNMLYSHDKKEALKFFYELSQNNNHIKTEDIKKNIHYYSRPSKYGKLEITINLSKPEKDPKEIAMAKLVKNNNDYPICQLCFENEGYEGRIDYPAKTNHRIVRFNLNEDETWGFQYSPYSYFNEHCIFLDKNHTPMKINKKTFEDLFSIVPNNKAELLFPTLVLGVCLVVSLFDEEELLDVFLFELSFTLEFVFVFSLFKLESLEDFLSFLVSGKSDLFSGLVFSLISTGEIVLSSISVGETFLSSDFNL